MKRWMWLFRPSVPTPRAQAIQVVHAAHAMAARGHAVRLCVEVVDGSAPAEWLGYYGLAPHPNLELVALRGGRTRQSAEFRARALQWVARDPASAVLIAREKRYAVLARRWLPGAFRLVLEAHEVDSVLAEERGEDGSIAHRLEAAALAAVDGVVANCPGTLALIGARHARLPPAIAAHNATHPSRVRQAAGEGIGALYAGSLIDGKDIDTLAIAASLARAPITAIGGDARARERAARLSGGKLVVEAPIAHRDVPDRLAAARVLVLPLGRGVFGEHLCSPLKLQDYLASGRAIVAADLPTIRAAAGSAYEPYVPGDAASLAAAIDRLYEDEALRAARIGVAKVRTWDERAAEIDAFVASLG